MPAPSQCTIANVSLSKTTYFCTEHACTEIGIYVPKWTVLIFCMYRKWLYRYIDIQCTETGCTEKICTESVCTAIVLYRKWPTP